MVSHALSPVVLIWNLPGLGISNMNFLVSGDLRQGSSNNSVTNFVPGFPYIFQRETQPSFGDLLLVVLVTLRRRSAIRF